MDDLRNRWAYSISGASIASFSVFLFFTVFLKLYDISSLLQWGGYAMALTAVVCVFSWPLKNTPSLGRMMTMGLSIPAFVIAVLSLTFSFLNPGFPDAMREGFETNINNIVQGGVIMFFVFSLLTFGVPYFLGLIVSILFTKHDADIG